MSLQLTEEEAFAALAAQTDEMPETMAPPTAWITDAMREYWQNHYDVVARYYGRTTGMSTL